MGNFAGSAGSHFTLHCDVSETTVDVPNNRSLVHCNVYITCDSTSTGEWNLDGTASWGANVNGNAPGGNFNFDFRSNANTVNLASFDTWCAHDGSGNATIGYSASANMQNSPSLTTSGVSGSLGLTHINRFSNITSFSASNVTDEGLTLSATCDSAASVINFSVDNGGSYSGGGSGTSASQTFHNLVSGQTYSCYAHTNNSASGLDAYSGNLQETTLPQNNFFTIRVP